MQRVGRKRGGGIEDGRQAFFLFPPSQPLTLLRIFSSGNISADDTVVKWKCHSAWLMLLSLTPNGKNPTTHAIFWTLHFLHPNSRRHIPHTIITQYHTHLLSRFVSPPSTHSQATQTHLMHLLLTFSFSKSLSTSLHCPSTLSLSIFSSPSGDLEQQLPVK